MEFIRPTLPLGTHELVTLALHEDIGTGDLTSAFFVESGRLASARLVARQPMVVSGLDVVAEVFRRLDPAIGISAECEEGSTVQAGGVLMKIKGRARAILSAERTALNFIQRLSGVATLTRRYVEAMAGTRARLLDTRKTTPGFRALEKRAVIHGGGTNHRIGLYDRVMIKDNHLAAAGGLAGLQEAIQRFHTVHPGLPVEIEADTLEQVRDFVKLIGVEFLLLDNMDPATLKRAVEINAGKLKLEASGGIDLNTIRAAAESGVDFVSVGAITHSACSVDIGLDFGSAGS